MKTHTEHSTRDGNGQLLVGHGQFATVVHETGDKPERIVRETTSAPGKPVRDKAE